MLAHDFMKKDDRAFVPTSSSTSAWYFSLLIVAKLLRCVGIFCLDSLAKEIHVIALLWMVNLIGSFIMLPIQKPFTVGKPIRKASHLRIGQLALLNCLIEIIWFYGITFCGPFRSILVFEQNPSVIMMSVLALFKTGGTTAKTRGAICLFIGYLALFVMDPDAAVDINHAEKHAHQSGLNHIYYHVINWFGISDHKSGILLLVLAVLLRMGYESNFRYLAVEIGGPKRLYSMISILSSAFLSPVAIIALTMNNSFIVSYFEFGFKILFAAAVVLVFDFYIESICFQNVADPVMAAARWSPITMFSCALILAWLSDSSSTTMLIGQHGLSAGVIITLICFCAASYLLTTSNTTKSRGGHFVGMSESGLPLYIYGEAFLQRTSRSVMEFCSETVKEILAHSESRRIFYFLCANLAFCSVEFFYGFISGSLGLISDGFHMLFDCSALVMGLVASVMARWSASRHYSFGYGRVEVLSGFINALFLIVIALFIFLEALERLYDPPDINTNKLMIVAVAGLCVNLFGMYAFTHGHSHGGGGDHGHSHGGHGHSHGGSNANMQGVFLHVLADTLGSVFVIISTLLIQWFGWKWVDPLCSLILSMLILGSVCPLLKGSASVLLQSVPEESQDEVDHILEDILHIEGVASYSQFHVWQLKSDLNVASIHVQISENFSEQQTAHRVQNLLKQHGITQVTVQVEKETFFRRIQALCPVYNFPKRVNRGAHIHSGDDKAHKPRKAKGDHGHGHSHDHDDHHGHSHESNCSSHNH